MKCPPKTNVEMELAVGTALQVRAKIKNLFFLPSADKLIISPAEESEDLFKLADTAASELYKTLPYTPIEAVGYNFAYELESGESFSLPVDFSGVRNKDVYKNIGASASSVSLLQHALVPEDDTAAVLNMSYKIAEEKKLLIMNYHYQVQNDGDKISHALGTFLKNYRHSKAVSSKMIVRS